LETYTGDFLCEVPDLSTLTREFGKCVDNVNFTGGFMERMPVIEGWQTTMFWAATWSGVLLVNQGGTYTFRLEAGIMDSASLTVNGAVAGSFDCTGGEVTVDLPSGEVSVVVTYSDYGWTDQMVLSWKGYDSSDQWEIVPAEAWKADNTCYEAPVVEDAPQDKCSYKVLDNDGGCGVDQGMGVQMHESCMCFKGFGEDDIMPWCESTCDGDADCKGFVKRSAFGMDTCMIATTGACPTDHMCNKMGGFSGDIVSFKQPFAGFEGCHVKDCPVSLVQGDHLAAVRPHEDVA